MHTRLASLLLIASAVTLSFASNLGSEVVIPVFRIGFHGTSIAELRTFIPTPTLFVGDHRFVAVILLAAACLFALVAVWRFPTQTLRCLTVGLCVQWLVVWTAAFCLCYAGFLGSVSIHHPQRFLFDNFLSLAGGVFPISFALIAAPLVMALWPTRRLT